MQDGVGFGDESDELRRAILKFLNQSKRMVLNLASILHRQQRRHNGHIVLFCANGEAEIKFAAL